MVWPKMVKLQFKSSGTFCLNFDGSILWNGRPATVVQKEDVVEVYQTKPVGLFELPLGGVKVAVDEKDQVWIGDSLAVQTNEPFEFKVSFEMLPNGIGKVKKGSIQSTLKIGSIQIQNQDDDWAINDQKAILSTKNFKLVDNVDRITMDGESGSLMIMDKRFLSTQLTININGSFRMVLPKQDFKSLNLNLTGDGGLIDGSSSLVEKAEFKVDGKSTIRSFKIKKEADLNVRGLGQLFLSKEKDTEVTSWVKGDSHLNWN